MEEFCSPVAPTPVRSDSSASEAVDAENFAVSCLGSGTGHEALEEDEGTRGSTAAQNSSSAVDDEHASPGERVTIGSCEILEHSRDKHEAAVALFTLIDWVKTYPTFRFGGVEGTRVCTLALRRIT